MRLFKNKVLLRWREPKHFLQYAKKHLTWKQWLRAYLNPFTKTFMLIIGLWVFVRLMRQDGEIVSWLAVGLATATALIACLMTWLISIAPIEIVVREKDIVKRTAEGAVSLPYKDMQRCIVKEIYLDDKSIKILEVRMNNGNECAFELASEISRQNIKEILEQKGVGVMLTGV